MSKSPSILTGVALVDNFHDHITFFVVSLIDIISLAAIYTTNLSVYDVTMSKSYINIYIQ